MYIGLESFIQMENKSASLTTIRIRGDTGHVEEMTQQIENDLDKTENQNENIVRITHDPVHDDMSEIVLVGESPETFDKAWNHENDY